MDAEFVSMGVWKCQKCEKWFIRYLARVSCAVNHGEDCCHLYDKETDSPEDVLRALMRAVATPRGDVHEAAPATPQAPASPDERP